MTPEQLSACAGITAEYASTILPNVESVFDIFDLSTPIRQASFLAQLGAESGLKPIEENLNYSATGLEDTFPKYFTADELDTFARNPQAIANRVYGGRMGNGPEASGDGWLFRGRGWIQITGRDNYKACGIALSVDLQNAPDLLLEDKWAALSAGWYWNSRNLNLLADVGDVVGLTKAINGGTMGLAQRLALYQAGRVALGIS